jgi:hypothetical protein
MSTFVHTCPVCGAEEGFEVLLARMIEDDETRRLVADVVLHSLPIGGLVLRYLQLHKPPKQKLRITKVRDILRELVPDIRRGAITRAGREWAISPAAWRDGFAAVHHANEQGSLQTPLDGNGYLYAVLMRQADRSEAREEQATQHGHKVGASRLRPETVVLDYPVPASMTPPAEPLVPTGLPNLPRALAPDPSIKARLAGIKAQTALKKLGEAPAKQPPTETTEGT